MAHDFPPDDRPAFTKFTAKRGIAKGFKWNATKNTYDKTPHGQLFDGDAERLTLKSAAHLVLVLKNMKPREALCWGVSPYPKARITTAAKLPEIRPDDQNPIISRTRRFYSYPDQTGVMMIDIDPPKDGSAAPLTLDEAIDGLVTCCPAASSTPMVCACSSSSHIWRGDDELIGPRGHHIYLFTTKAADIGRAGKVLFQRSWLKGLGRIEIGSAGQLLVRSFLDGAVWQPERLDFGMKADCGDGIEQRQPPPEIRNEGGPFLDTRAALPDLTPAEQAEFKRLVADAQKSREVDAAPKREEWAQGRAREILRTRKTTPEKSPEDFKRLVDSLRSASATLTLDADIVLHTPHGKTVTVGEIMADPEKWREQRFADPLEPDYGKDSRIAVFDEKGGIWGIFSHAHGGVRYKMPVMTQAEAERNEANSEDGAQRQVRVDDKKKPCQLELAREVIDCIGAENVLHDGRSFWRWNERGVWSSVDDREVKRVVQHILEGHGKVTRSAVDGVADITKTETFSPVLLEHTKPFVNCQNGELHWNGLNWDIQPHKKDNLSISQIPVKWEDSAECPRFEIFLEEIFAGDDDAQKKRQLLLELIGYSLVPSAEFEKFALLVGNGANGKSVVLQVLQALLGRENCASVSPAQFNNRFQRAHLHGKLANLVSELSEGAILADAELKAIVSGELITAEHKMQTPFDFRPTCTVWFATNHMPSTRDFSDAIFRRACVLKFNRKFEQHEQDAQLKNKLTQELPGILRVALDAYGGVMRCGAFTLPSSVVEARQEWRLDADQVAAFVEDQVERVVGEKTTSQTVFDSYRRWANDAGISHLVGRKVFTQRLERLGFQAAKSTGGTRVIWGVRLKDQKVLY
uniref:SF3 helicase domain-containing protein n=1 Tax=uncultured prokaryote TaxID=198431 RepID=A0A0H5Q0M6_9ZZZZ|nr:hypothetical protein [uncultured prokaryote]